MSRPRRINIDKQMKNTVNIHSESTENVEEKNGIASGSMGVCEGACLRENSLETEHMNWEEIAYSVDEQW